MFSLFYTIFIKSAEVILKLLSSFNKKLSHFLESRKNAKGIAPGSKSYWIHCASLGEFEMARPLIELILKDFSKDELLITFFSPSGYQYATKIESLRDCMMYVPLDSADHVRAFYSKYKIEKAIFVRYELWYNLVRIGMDQGTDFYLINARFRPEQFLFKFFGKAYLKLLRKFSMIYTSDVGSYQLLVSRNFSNLQESGDTRFDRVKQIKDHASEYPLVRDFTAGKPTVILGSSWQAEEKAVREVMSELPDLKWIIAPHDISKWHIREIMQLYDEYEPKLYSEENFNHNDKLLIIDSIGHLSALYQYADLTVVGGGFKGALHNTFEPLIWGSPVLFGPEHDKNPEAKEFMKAGIAFSFSNPSELKSSIESCLSSVNELKGKCSSYLQGQVGSTSKIWDQLKRL